MGRPEVSKLIEALGFAVFNSDVYQIVIVFRADVGATCPVELGAFEGNRRTVKQL